MTRSAHRVLVMEDDDPVRLAISQALRGGGYEVLALHDGTSLDEMLDTFRPDLAVVSVQLSSGPDGFAIGRRLLASDNVLLIFLSALGEVHERLTGFGLGADDYITKPFDMEELVARVRAVLRRLSGVVPRRQVGPVSLDLNVHAASVHGVQLNLTKTEFALLESFFRTPGKVLSKSQLMRDIWSYDRVNPNVVEVHVSALRRKIEAHVPRIIDTVHGIGYILRDDPAPDLTESPFVRRDVFDLDGKVEAC